MSIEASALTARNDYYEDFNVGDVYEHARGKTVEGLENVLITNLVLNTAQAHFNEHMAESLPQKHRITFGGVTASIVIGLAMEDTGEQAVEEIALDKIRFRVPVLHGDTLYAYTEVVAKEDEPADSRGYRDVGLVHFRHWGVNQRGETVFEGERKALIKRRSFSTAGLAIPAATVAQEAPAPSMRAQRKVARRAKPKTARKQPPKLPTKGVKTRSDKAAQKRQPARPKDRRQARPKRR